MEAQVLLKKGAVRRIGGGDSVSITDDPWLPSAENSYVQSTHEAITGKVVSFLMCPGRNEWNMGLLNEFFTERDVNLIRTIPIRQAENDSWYWKGEKLGKYTVKSAYNMLHEERFINGLSNNSGFWRTIWNLKIPQKTKIFMWRALTNLLPSKDQLRVRRVEVNPFCPVCNLEQESTFHCLVMCPVAVQCWGVSSFNKVSHTATDYIKWMEEVVKACNRDEVAKICMLCWYLWKNRNDIVWNQRSLEPLDIVRAAEISLNQWRCAQDKSFDNYLGSMTQADGKTHWERPQIGRIKINTDAALFEESNRYCYSMIARDHYGALVEAAAYCKQGTIEPIMAEALGIKEALSWVKKGEYNGVIIESDCLALIQAIRSATVNLSYLGRIVQDCKSMLVSLKERNITLNFVKRSANRVAHYIARTTSSLAERKWKRGDAYLNFHHVLTEDLNG